MLKNHTRGLYRVRIIAIWFLLALDLTLLNLTGADVSATPLGADRPLAEKLAAIDRFVEQEILELRLPGLALGIVQGDQVIHLQGFGYADPARTPITPQTPFVLESISKSFTAVAWSGRAWGFSQAPPLSGWNW